MEYVQPEFYDRFKCIGGVCEDSCCIGWEVEVDDDTYDYYASVRGPFGERLKSNMADGEEKSFVIKKNGRCPFLNKENLCDIFTELGEENLCSVCTDFPRIYAQIGEYKQVAVSISCMEAGRLLFAIKEPLTFVAKKDDIAPDEDISVNDKHRFSLLRNTRNIAIALMQTRDVNDKYISWRKRACCIIEYVENVQKLWNCGKEDETKDICKKDDIKQYLTNWMSESVHSESCNSIDYHNYCMEMLGILDGLLPINEKWKKEYKSAMKIMKRHFSIKDWKQFQKDVNGNSEVWFEHLMVYFIYKYHILALYDNNILTKIKFAVASCIIIECLDYSRWKSNGRNYSFEDRVDVAHLYSREVEHSEDNLENLTEEIMFDEVFEVDNLKKILLSSL